MNSKPRILVTGPSENGNAMWLLNRTLIELSGGTAIRFIAAHTTAPSPDSFDGLILGGGDDIDPGLYGEKPIATNSLCFDRKNDETELDLLRQALDRKIPVLGVCRGIQIINVFHGGTLHQDISGFFPAGKVNESRLPFKLAKIAPQSSLADTLRNESIPINAMHTQAVKDVPDSLKAVSWEKVGLVQGLESRLSSNILGVQWHPEFLFYIAGQRRLYEWLVSEAKRTLGH
ncbi:MAG: hypothetical protein EOP10_31365 [Proteobacteria bacterium]|nr:MAG: hypothetical protein EOP10_31365 [Pseudomonadota bacterium]